MSHEPVRAMPRTAILIGQPHTCRRVERQLDLLDPRPITIGWVMTPSGLAPGSNLPDDGPVLGTIDELESVLAHRRAAVALISLPAAMSEAVSQIRTRLRRLGVPDRFIPTMEDHIAGIGPRTHIDLDLASLIDRPPRRFDVDEVRRIIQARRVLVTGAGGSIGSELCRLLAQSDPAELLMVERGENALFEIDRQIARRHPQLARKALLHDIVDAKRTLALFQGTRPDVIFHAAAHKHVPMMEDHPAQAIDNNVFGTIAVADAANAVEAERFVMISTDKAVNPTSVMGATKRLAEVYVQALNQRSTTGFAIVRFGNVLGSTGSVLDTWARQVADGGPLTVTDPRMTRYFMTIPEAASLVVQAAALIVPTSKDGEVFLLDMGEPVKIVDLACRFAAQHGLLAVSELEARGGMSSRAAAGTIGIVFTGARPGEKLFEELVFDAQCMRPTRHPDINIWGLPEPDPQDVEELVRLLGPTSRPSETRELASLVRRLVPESSQSIVSVSI